MKSSCSYLEEAYFWKRDATRTGVHHIVVPELVKQSDKIGGWISLSQSVAVVEETLVGFSTEPFSPYKVKLEAVVKRNTDWPTAKKFAAVLNGDGATVEIFDPQIVVNFKYAPIFTVEVERSFSSMKNTLSSQLEWLTLKQLRLHLVVMWSNSSDWIE